MLELFPNMNSIPAGDWCVVVDGECGCCTWTIYACEDMLYLLPDLNLMSNGFNVPVNCKIIKLLSKLTLYFHIKFIVINMLRPNLSPWTLPLPVPMDGWEKGTERIQFIADGWAERDEKQNHQIQPMLMLMLMIHDNAFSFWSVIN